MERRQDGGWQFKCFEPFSYGKSLALPFTWYFETHWLPKHYCRQSKLCHGNIGNGNWIFQQDNVTCHSAEGVQEWFEEHNFRMLPPNSQDLKPIEHLQYALDKQVRALEAPP